MIHPVGGKPEGAACAMSFLHSFFAFSTASVTYCTVSLLFSLLPLVFVMVADKKYTREGNLGDFVSGLKQGNRIQVYPWNTVT